MIHRIYRRGNYMVERRSKPAAQRGTQQHGVCIHDLFQWCLDLKRTMGNTLKWLRFAICINWTALRLSQSRWYARKWLYLRDMIVCSLNEIKGKLYKLNLMNRFWTMGLTSKSELNDIILKVCIKYLCGCVACAFENRNYICVSYG